MSLTLAKLVDALVERESAFHPKGSLPWSGAHWGNAMGGECGEAQNIVKKINRMETKVKAWSHARYESLRHKLGLELADMIMYAVHLANHYQIDLEAAIIDKFNQVSEDYGLPHRLPDAA